MLLNFADAIAALGGQTAMVRVANEARPPADYLFASILPEMAKNSYYVDSGSMTVRATMAGLAAMDSPYPPGGAVAVSTFLEQSAKIANRVILDERSLRQLQEFALRVMAEGNSTLDMLQREALNFYQKVIVQAHLDTAEWLRGQALATGAIDWTFNNLNLVVDYGVPNANKLTARTTGGGTAYGAASSSFWDDWREAQRLLKYNVRAVIMRTSMFHEIIENSANSVEVVNQEGNTFSLSRYQTIGGNTVRTSDARDRVQVITYDLEVEKLDPANPGQTTTVPVLPENKIIFIGNSTRSGYRVGEGSTADVDDTLALGYTHIAPTVEGNGRAGRWGRVYTPEQKPYQIVGEGVSNMLPVLENVDKIVIATSELA